MELKGRLMAAIEGWRGYQAPETPLTRAQQYSMLWDLYTGEMFNPAWRRQGVFANDRVYRNTRLVWKHAQAVVDFYASVTYQGQLSTDGKPLPDGSLGAIPINPQTGNDAADDALLVAVAELWSRWKWQRSMRLRPRYAAALGDCLTQLVDDPERHAVWPQLVWPGYVTELLLDIVGDIKAYTLEYKITREEHGQDVTFRYRKEVDKDEFRYFRDDNPWTDTREGGHGDAVQPNPYGFVPAIWDRHKTVWGDRGLSAIAGTRQALFEFNSFLSHGIDYQRKPFSAAVLLRSERSSVTKAKEVLGPGRDEDPSKLAETMNVKKVGVNDGYDYLQADIGQTLSILQMIKDGILEENPEASFYHDLREMSQLTGPAVERALGDAVSRANEARAEHDPQTVKLQQMALTMCAMALNDGRWEEPTKRDEVFRSFNENSFKAGLLDMGILGRPVVPATLSERIDTQRNQIGLYEDLSRLPRELIETFEVLDKKQIDALLKARESDRLQAERLINRGGVNPAFDDEEDDDAA